MHWAARYRRLRDWSDSTKYAFALADKKEIKKLQNKRILVEVTIGFARNARRDPHNYVGTVVKSIVDALVTTGLVPDDVTEYIKVAEPVLIVDKSELCTIKLTKITSEE
jgi:hypothetical protein